MNRQKSFQNEEAPALYLVPTPIGNRTELSARARTVLESADVIACEDTRNSGQLLKSLDIHKPLIAHHEFNAAQSSRGILKLLEEGKKVAVISDAGYPLISDPGAQLVEACTDAGYPVIPLSGPNAALDALVASGLETAHFLFYGFLNAKETKRKAELHALKAFPYTMIFYEAPHRIERMLADALDVLGDRKICLARELTKLHEEFLRGTISEVLAACSDLKGEMVVVIAGASEDESASALSFEQVVAAAIDLCAQGNKPKAAAGMACSDTPFSKNEVYAAMMQTKEQNES